MKQKWIGMILISSLIFLMVSCGQNGKLKDVDLKVIDDLQFDKELISNLRKLTAKPFLIVTGNRDKQINYKDPLNYNSFAEKKLRGLALNESQRKTEEIVTKLRDTFNAKGYQLYISEANLGLKLDVVTVLKTEDKYDILRFEGINGLNFKLYVEDIIAKITEWDQAYGLDIIAVSFDFFKAAYKKLPDNLSQHAKDLFAFCPDTVNQGAGSVEALQTEIAKTKQMYLWWN